MNWNYFSRYLQKTENEKADVICGVTWQGFNAWQVIKTPYYFFRIQSSAKNNAVPRFYTIKKFARSLEYVLYYALFILTYAVFKRNHKKPAVLISAFTGDKLAKNEHGKYFNYLVDAFVTEGMVKDYLYMEHSLNGEFKKPSCVTAGVKTDFLLKAAQGYKFLYGKKLRADNVASQLNSLLDDEELSAAFTSAQREVVLKNILVDFAAEYKISTIFLKAVRPRLILCSETPGTGFMAAANNLRISAVDMQHGIIDPAHPQYVYSGKLKCCKQHLVLPDRVGVFGSFHKKILMRSGFWSGDEIIELGSYRMESTREKYSSVQPEARRSFSILFPTQWTSFNDMMLLLKMLGGQLPEQVRIVVKLHPLEYAANVEKYYKLQADFPSLEIKEKDTDIYELIRSSFLMIGFDSAVLLESISLGTPAITIGTKESPNGIHSVLENDYLESTIRMVDINDKEKLVALITRAIEDKDFYASWKTAAVEKGDELYKSDYINNCRKFIQSNSLRA
ncbi:MAG: hypothetical protein WCF67_21130 [Chitinophagaceae bacterium]